MQKNARTFRSFEKNLCPTLYISGNLAQACLSGVTLAGLNLNFVMKDMSPYLVLKIKSRKMASLPFMTHRKSSLFKICCELTNRKY